MPLRPLPLTALLLLAAAVLGWLAWSGGWPGATWLLDIQQRLQSLHANGPWAFALSLFVLFTLFSALALPGCSVLALTAGATLGWGWGTALVALASTAGATLSFLAARHLWRDAVQRRWGHRLAPLQDGLARDGALYLFVLRLVPLIPFPLLNPLMGLSAMPVGTFALTSLFGMLLGSAAFVYAGTAVGGLQAGTGAGSALVMNAGPLMVGLTAALLLPLAARHWWRRRCLTR
jgi:uncharacterized membrane protein YdjX (TVP38/TMEM64 family)